MILKINDNQFLIDLQEKFNECFPYLKIEFYDQPCSCGKSLSAHHHLPSNLRLCNCRSLYHPGLLDIKSYYKVSQVEMDFIKDYGLNVQIYRREGNSWVSTHKTKNLTLQQQSDIAQQRLRIAKSAEAVA